MRKLLVTALAFAGLLAGWATFAAVEIGKLRPPNEFLASFLAAMPEPREWRTFSQNDADYLAAFGPPRSPIRGRRRSGCARHRWGAHTGISVVWHISSSK